MLIAQRPFVNGFDKKSATPNEIVTISGSNFMSPTVWFGNGKATTIVNSSTNNIQVRVPATATYGPITVINGDGLSATSSGLFAVSFMMTLVKQIGLICLLLKMLKPQEKKQRTTSVFVIST